MDGCGTPLGEWIEQVERFLLARLNDRELCRDIAQESASRFVACLGAGVSIGDPRAWLFRAARNLAVDAIRRRLPGNLGLELLAGVPDPRPEREEEEPRWRLGEHTLRRSELVLLLPEALDQLPEHYRRALCARYEDGLACEALAAQERISTHNAKIRLHRARRRLRDLLVLAVRRGAGSDALL